MLQHTLGKFGVHISMAPIVPSHLARCCGGTGNLNLNFKLGHYTRDAESKNLLRVYYKN
jgi:hypothetical protein